MGAASYLFRWTLAAALLASLASCSGSIGGVDVDRDSAVRRGLDVASGPDARPDRTGTPGPQDALVQRDVSTWPVDAAGGNTPDASGSTSDAQAHTQDSGTVPPDSGSGSQADSGAIVDMCANYPPTDGKMNIGNPVRNYHWVDKNGNEHYLCELATGSNRYLYLVMASKT